MIWWVVWQRRYLGNIHNTHHEIENMIILGPSIICRPFSFILTLNRKLATTCWETLILSEQMSNVKVILTTSHFTSFALWWNIRKIYYAQKSEPMWYIFYMFLHLHFSGVWTRYQMSEYPEGSDYLTQISTYPVIILCGEHFVKASQSEIRLPLSPNSAISFFF